MKGNGSSEEDSQKRGWENVTSYTVYDVDSDEVEKKRENPQSKEAFENVLVHQEFFKSTGKRVVEGGV